MEENLDQEPEAATEINFEQEYSKLKEEFDKTKLDRDGQNRANSKLKLEMDELQKKVLAIEEEKLSKEELLEKRQIEWEAERKLKAAELSNKEREINIARAIMDVGIDPEFKDFLDGETYEDIVERANLLKNKIDQSATGKTKQALGNVDKGNPIPFGDSLTKKDLFEKAQKEGDLIQQLRLAKTS